MIRNWILLLTTCAIPSPVLAQCAIGPGLQQYEFTSSAIGQRGLGGLAFTVTATCRGQVNAHVKFKLDTSGPADTGLIVSPSSGTTPLELQVGVDPNRVGNAFRGSGPRFLHFTTIDQNPPSTPTIIVRVTITTPDPPVIQSVVNAASLAPVVSPGAVVLIRGASLGPNMAATLDQTGIFPTTLGNTTVTFNGIPASLLSSSRGIIRAVAPYGLSGQTAAQVIVTHYPSSPVEQVSAAFSVPVADTALGIFSKTPSGSGQADILNCDATGCASNSVDNPAAPGSIVVFFATGMAPWAGPGIDGSIAILPRHSGNLASLTIGGQPAQILYAGVAPYQVWGVFQVNALVPKGIASGPQAVVLTVGQASNASQQTTLAVQ